VGALLFLLETPEMLLALLLPTQQQQELFLLLGEPEDQLLVLEELKTQGMVVLYHLQQGQGAQRYLLLVQELVATAEQFHLLLVTGAMEQQLMEIAEH
jgi:hypothetical protein